MLSDALFLSTAVHKRTIALADGSEHELYFKEAPSGVFQAYWRAGAAADADTLELARAKLIAASVVNADGTAALTIERAGQLKPMVSDKIIGAVLEVNGFIAPPKTDAAEAAPGNA